MMSAKELIKLNNICIHDLPKEDFRLDNIHHISSTQTSPFHLNIRITVHNSSHR